MNFWKTYEVVLAILIHKGYKDYIIDINLVYEDSKSYQAHKVVLVVFEIFHGLV